MIEDVTYYDEGTMFKVRAALHEALDAEGVAWDYLLDACVTEMQNAGILFRERREESKPVPYCPACDLGEGHTGPHVKLPPHEPDQLPARGEGDRPAEPCPSCGQPVRVEDSHACIVTREGDRG